MVHRNIVIEGTVTKMKTAQAIKDKKQIQDLLEVYPYGSKNHLLIAYALYTGLRIGDILEAKVGDSLQGVWDGREQKTGKGKIVQLNSKLQAIIKYYVASNKLSPSDYLFFSSKDRSKHIERSRADKIIRKAGDMIGLTVSAHSLRKTFGYLAYSNGVDIALLMEIFQHSSQRITLRYIGITQDNINEVYESIDLGI